MSKPNKLRDSTFARLQEHRKLKGQGRTACDIASDLIEEALDRISANEQNDTDDQGLNLVPEKLDIPEEPSLAGGVQADWDRFLSFITAPTSLKIPFEDVPTVVDESPVDDHETEVVDLPEADIEEVLRPPGAFNRMTFNGVAPGTLNFVLGDPSIGKSLVLDHLAASYLRLGKSVVFFTLELSHYETYARIFANYLDTDLNTFFDPTLPTFDNDVLTAVGKLIVTFEGNLDVKPYLYSEKHVGHFSSYIKRLSFKPDVIIVDAAEHCLAQSGAVNMAVVPKDLKALALKKTAILWSAIQSDQDRGERTPVSTKMIAGSQAFNRYADLVIGLNKVHHPVHKDTHLALRMLRSKHAAKDDGYEIVRVEKSKMRLYDGGETGIEAKELVDDWYRYRDPNAVAPVVPPVVPPTQDEVAAQGPEAVIPLPNPDEDSQGPVASKDMLDFLAARKDDGDT